MTIDNHDGAGVREYTAWLARTPALRITRRLNRPTQMKCVLAANDAQFVVPVTGARVTVAREDGHKVFTGYLTAAPQFEYLGWGGAGPAYRYALHALSDESLLDRKLLPQRVPFIQRTAGDVLKQMAESIAPGQLDLAGVQACGMLPQFSSTLQRPFSEQAADVALRARAAYRAHDGAITLAPLGRTVHTLDSSSAQFVPEALVLNAPQAFANDVITIGRVEPRAFVRDYFLGDGITSSFSLSQKPFTKSAQTVFEEEFTAALDSKRWIIQDPALSTSVSNGALVLNGGTGTDGQTTLAFAEQLELGGAVVMQHGEVSFLAGSDGVVGGIYSGTIARGNCFAGFRIAPGANSTIRALVQGSEVGSILTTVSGHHYALTTRIYGNAFFRSNQAFHSSTATRGGDAVPANVRLVLEVHDIDPTNPGTLQVQSTVLYDAVIANAPGYCTYAVANAVSMHADIAFTRLLRGVDVEVRSAIPAQAPRTRLVGGIAEGAECTVTASHQLVFFSPSVPVPNEAIEARYRAGGRAIARVLDATSIAANTSATDDGHRAAVRRILQPPARTSVDCENAALAILDDSTHQAWSGEYSCWSDLLDAGSDPLPGDVVHVIAPARNADFIAIVREVDMEAVELSGDHSRYTLRFANDAAEDAAMQFAEGVLHELLDAATPGVSFLPDVPDAQITSLTSTTVTIVTNLAPPAGGGFEVRRTDTGWGSGNDRNLAGRFTTQTITVPRLTRVQNYHLRQYDASTPPRYSRNTTTLHIDYPL